MKNLKISDSWTASNSSGPMLTMAMTKSCPTTPRGSVPDLRNGLDDEKDEFDENVEDRVSRRAPRYITMLQIDFQVENLKSKTKILVLIFTI